jgi:hypothetical protein
MGDGRWRGGGSCGSAGRVRGQAHAADQSAAGQSLFRCKGAAMVIDAADKDLDERDLLSEIWKIGGNYFAAAR